MYYCSVRSIRVGFRYLNIEHNIGLVKFLNLLEREPYITVLEESLVLLSSFVPYDSISIPLANLPVFNYVFSRPLAPVHLDGPVVYLGDALLKTVRKCSAHRCNLVFVVGVASVTINDPMNETLK